MKMLPYKSVVRGLTYIKSNYKSPSGAVKHSRTIGWYKITQYTNTTYWMVHIDGNQY